MNDDALERRRAYDRARYKGERKEAAKMRAKAAYERNPEKVKAQATAWNKANPEARRRIHLKRQYGISPADFDEMARAQAGRCGICAEKPNELVVDHDHVTGRVRGLLCRKCNAAIGQLGDDPAMLARAIVWLEER